MTSFPRRRALDVLLLCAAIVLLDWAVATNRAQAWNFSEHKEIGLQAYKRACQGLADAAVDVASQRRLALACGRSVTFGEVFSQACAIAGDHVDSPEDLTSALGGARATSAINYFSLALLNNEHFQPFSRRTWQVHHARAASAALDVQLADEYMRWERALFLEAFAQHFLQDSFAAGHMGFNRAASGATASKVFHDEWNDRGRFVHAPNGAGWYTCGDGHYGSASCASGREHLVAAATSSLSVILRAFVSGDAQADKEALVGLLIPDEAGEGFVSAFFERFRREHGCSASRPAPKYGPSGLEWEAGHDCPSPPAHPDSRTDQADIEYRSLLYIRQPATYRVQAGFEVYVASSPGGAYMAEGGTLGFHRDFNVPFWFSLDLNVFLGWGGNTVMQVKSGPAMGFSYDLSILRSGYGFVRFGLEVGALAGQAWIGRLPDEHRDDSAATDSDSPSSAAQLFWGAPYVAFELGDIMLSLGVGVSSAHGKAPFVLEGLGVTMSVGLRWALESTGGTPLNGL